MEKRKIYINDTERNNVITLETDATTFGEVKRAAIAAGVNVEGKDWLEGITKTTPTSDDSLLPVGVSYKGAITNDLVFVLTNTNKRIKSGATSRAEIYAEIKRLNLQEVIKAKYGKNFTQCSTLDLLNALGEADRPAETVGMNAPEVVIPKTNCNAGKDFEAAYKSVVDNMAKFIINMGPEFIDEMLSAIKFIKEKMDNESPKSLNLSADEIMDIFK